MDRFVIALVLCSAVMHAVWNLIARRQRSERVFIYRMLVLTVSIGFLPAVISELLTQSLAPKVWLLVLGSGFVCGLYYFFLGLGYESSDFTVVYPVARALPVLMVGVGDVFRGRYPTTVGWAGMVLVVIGCLLAPFYSFRGFSRRAYFNRASIWMLLAALGTVGYTLFDKVASEIVSPGPAAAARYGYVFFLFSLVSYSAVLRAFRVKCSSDTIGWKYPFLAACLCYGSYWMVLWAYQMSRHASYIVAFRQSSIVVGVLLAFAVYKERGKTVRLTATLLITAGLVVIGLWGR